MRSLSAGSSSSDESDTQCSVDSPEFELIDYNPEALDQESTPGSAQGSDSLVVFNRSSPMLAEVQGLDHLGRLVEIDSKTPSSHIKSFPNLKKQHQFIII